MNGSINIITINKNVDHLVVGKFTTVNMFYLVHDVIGIV